MYRQDCGWKKSGTIKRIVETLQWDKPPINWCRISSIHRRFTICETNSNGSKGAIRSGLHLLDMKQWFFCMWKRPSSLG